MLLNKNEILKFLINNLNFDRKGNIEKKKIIIRLKMKIYIQIYSFYIN